MTNGNVTDKQNGHRPRRKVMVIGLDGATFDLITPWAEAGYLPTLGKIMRTGVHSILRSTVPPMTAPAWTSFATGVNPGKHRLYDWVSRKEGTYNFVPVTAVDGKAPTIFHLLGSRGRRVCSINVPMTYPAAAVNGVMISGMPAPSLDERVFYPASLHQEILEQVGDYILYPDPGQAYSDSGIDAFLERLYRCTELRVKTLTYLQNRESWDFSMVVFSGTDTIGHALWRFMDRNHPRHDPSRSERYGDQIRDFYRAVDGYLADIIAGLDSETNLIIMSDHGFGPFHKFIHVNNWLIDEGFMRISRSPKAAVKGRLFKAGFAPMNIYNLLMQLGLGGLKREVVRGQGQGLLKTLFLSFSDVDWSQTRAYSLGNVGQVYVNLVGREPYGSVQPGAEYEEVRSDVIARLRELRDPETGEKAVEAVYRREEVYSGDYVGQAPDVLFIPTRMEYFGFGEYEFGSHRIIETVKRGISGTHRMDGIFLATGPDIRPAELRDTPHLTDLAPTILHLMGEPVPAHMDGRVLMEILPEDFPAVQKTTLDDWGMDGDAGDGDLLSEEEKQILTERLRDLGYVG